MHTRRELLGLWASGFGGLAFASLLADEARANTGRDASGVGRGAALPRLHFAPKAKSVIFLYMDGGPSQIDTFDPKPALAKWNGKALPFDTPRTQFNDSGAVLASPWKFDKYGQSGLEVSELFPETAKHADKLCVIRSMTSGFSEHTNANYFFHTGNGAQGRPSVGAWMSYGLGSMSQELPGFVVVHGGLVPPGGLDCFGAGFLPPSHQGSIFLPRPQPVADLSPSEATPELQKRKLALLQKLDKSALGRMGDSPQVEGAIANYELAFRMQSSLPALADVKNESEATRKMYGLEHSYGPTRTYGMQCLLARRLVEQGVRFVELTCPHTGHDRWDQHSNLKAGHEDNARAVDTPIAGLLTDLQQRGLLDSTLVLWGGEFGRTPMAQAGNGRDHNPFGFTVWMAGGGVKGGMVYGATDEWGYFAVDKKAEVYDLHATILHLLGVDHKRLTVRFGGRDMRLTDVHGTVLTDILA
jgi:hypothetical protein